MGGKGEGNEPRKAERTEEKRCVRSGGESSRERRAE